MSTTLTINVRNYQDVTQDFYIFQEPAIYSGGSKVYSNSLYTEQLGNYDKYGAILTFEVNLQFYAGIQQANTPPAIGQTSGFESAWRAVNLTPASGTAVDNSAEASIDPIGMLATTSDPNAQPGSFRIVTPEFFPPAVNIGSAVETRNGGIVLSNFITAKPLNFTDCQPIIKYYVQTGGYRGGTVMNFTQSSINAGLCDFTGGVSAIDVSLQPNGRWDVTAVG